MRIYLLLISLIPTQSFGKAPECPAHQTKRECLLAVEDQYDSFLDFINNTTDEGDERNKLIQASRDIRKYETLACQKTCLN